MSLSLGFGLKLLSGGEIDAIEERYLAGNLKDDDVDRLLHTARSLLERAAPEKKCRVPRTVSSSEPGDFSRKSPLRAEVFTDGACKGNPGPGGWGALVRIGRRERELSGGVPYTTNNRMEMTAVIEALESLPPSSQIVLTTDSQYIQKGITQWIRSWKKNGWINSAKEPVKNMDLWKRLDELSQKHTVEWRWVKGHNGHKENERCDELARKAISKADRRQ